MLFAQNELQLFKTSQKYVIYNWVQKGLPHAGNKYRILHSELQQVDVKDIQVVKAICARVGQTPKNWG